MIVFWCKGNVRCSFFIWKFLIVGVVKFLLVIILIIVGMGFVEVSFV